MTPETIIVKTIIFGAIVSVAFALVGWCEMMRIKNGVRKHSKKNK